jgi:hypothetical protein
MAVLSSSSAVSALASSLVEVASAQQTGGDVLALAPREDPQQRSPDGTCDPPATSNHLGVAQIASPLAEDGATLASA